MARYRKRPVEVEAVVYQPLAGTPGVNEVVHDPGDGSTQTCGYGYCLTAHGEWAKVVAGDYVIAEPDGRGHYPCKPDIFLATYEPVT